MKTHRLVLFFIILILPGQLFAQGLVGSKKSNKYHYPHCRSAQGLSAENMIEFRSADEAVAAGYVPCKVCKPPMPKTKALQRATEPQKGQTYTQPAEENRCQAITKKGTRCKRKALPGSKYCAQHKK